ncbi:Thymus-specific serine protease [Tolypocladium capitatum]|uniref:Thymus-specific serine protease n=1 Tax=Tolypocladium capitatum TaxID=45235 RepID=A0A2K3Q347_9HYPO|nr:Thymus-specific serine protease [Tolypocladium capitatum]
MGLSIPNRPLPPKDDYTVDIFTGVPGRASTPSGIVAGYFQQLIDHKNPSLGTFTQRYWWNADHYAGPGSPVVLNTPGESNADGYQGYTTNRTLPGLFAQSTGGAAILLEHRYWGGSSPFDNLTAETMQYLDLDNSVADLVYFAKTVSLPFDPTGSSKPDKAPWVLSGCSYPGALTAWTNALAPGTFWAYHCSSAVVEAISTMWEYFAPVEMAMPRNCTADMKRIIAHVDDVLINGEDKERQQLKTLFGFGDLEHDDDFASALTTGLGLWQGTQFYSGYTSLNQMCDYIENQWPGSNRTAPGPYGVGVHNATQGFAKWSREIMIPGSCGPGFAVDSVACYDSYDKTSLIYTDTSVNNTVNRQWMWFLCNEPFEYWQAWGPDSDTGIISKLVTRDYFVRQCADFFPDVKDITYGLNRGRTVDQLNAKTGGWNHVDTKRLMWISGEYDPWRPATVSADLRPGGPLESTKQAPVWVLPKASHCNDVIVNNGIANPVIMKIMQEEVVQMKKWVEEFYNNNGWQGEGEGGKRY